MLTNEVINWVAKTLGDDISKKVLAVNEKCILVDKKNLLRVLFVIKYRCNFLQLVDMTALDMLRINNNFRFKLVYIFRNYENNQILEINVNLQENEKIQSIMEAFSNADWYEREIHEMFGIQFRQRPDLKNLLLPEEIVNFPLRKDVIL